MMHDCPPTLSQPAAPAFKRRRDPILEELWAVKAQLNAAANYDVKRLLEDARDSVVKLREQGLI